MLKRTHTFGLFTLFLIAVLSSFSTQSRAQLWEQTNGPVGVYLRSICCDSAGGVYANNTTSLFYSSDRGGHWKNITAPFDSLYFIKGAVNKSGALILAGVRPHSGKSDAYILITSDLGKTWHTDTIARLVETIFVDVAVDRNGQFLYTTSGQVYFADKSLRWDSTIYSNLHESEYSIIHASRYGAIFISHGNTEKTLYRSTDDGHSWAKVVNGLDGGAMWVHDSTDGVLRACAHNAWCRSIDNGRTWATSSESPNIGEYAIDTKGNVLINRVYEYQLNADSPVNEPAQLFPDAVISVSSDGVFYTGYRSGLAIVDPSSASSQSPASHSYVQLPTGSPTSLIVIDTVILSFSAWDYFPLSGNMLSHSIDGGNSWSWAKQDPPMALGQFTLDSTGVIISFGYDGNCTLLTSTANGDSWTKGTQLSTSNKITDICTSPNGSTFVSTELEGIFRTTDHGATWDQLNVGLPSQLVQAITVNAQGEVFAATPEGISKSTNDGVNWTFLDQPGIGRSAKLVVNSAGYIICARDSVDVFISKDDGFSWEPIGSGLPANKKFNALLSTPDGHVFAATDSGLYYLPLAGAAWENANAGLTELEVLSLARSKGGTVYAGVRHGGVFRSLQTYNLVNPKSVESSAKAVAACSVVPNPARESVIVRVSEPGTSIEVYSVLGQRVRTFDGGERTEVSVPTNDLANGAYTVVIHGRSRTQSIPLIVAH